MEMMQQPIAQMPPPQMPQAYPPAPPPPAPPVQYAPPPPPMMEAGGGLDGNSGLKSISKELWIGFVFAFLTGVGIGYIYNEKQKGKFPKLF